MASKSKPKGYEKYLGEYGVVSFDGYSGVPVLWGWKIHSYLGEPLFDKLRSEHHLHCISPGNWAIVDRSLSLAEAIDKYGKITKVVVGPRGGSRHTVFSKKMNEVDKQRKSDSIVTIFSSNLRDWQDIEIPENLYEVES